MENKNFFLNEEIEYDYLGNSIKRKVLAYNDEIMMVEVYFSKGAIGPNHTHIHSQATYVLKGEFEYNVDGKKQIVKQGDTIYMQPDVDHGTVCLKEGILLDVFTPHREDFLKNKR